MPSKKPIIVYHLRGSIEKWTSRRTYVRANGYSETTEEGNVLYPWMFHKECLADAKRRGATATFVCTTEQSEE